MLRPPCIEGMHLMGRRYLEDPVPALVESVEISCFHLCVRAHFPTRSRGAYHAHVMVASLDGNFTQHNSR